MRIDTTWHQGRLALSTLSLGIVTTIASTSRADNPIVQTSYTADPAPMLYDGRLYLYTSHDEDVTVNDFYTMNDWRLYSTVDMVNWTDHGSPASYKTFSWGTGDAWAPQGVARDGTFYLYVPLNNATGARIGVGVSTRPAGPFTDPLGKALASTGSGDIDPTVFVDDDGQAHLYWGNAKLWYAELNTDMMSYSGSPIQSSATGYLEGPWLYKRGSLYYLAYAASGTGTEKISYATSAAPTGPWTYGGDIMGSGKTFTNHPGIVDYKGHSYFFYHNSALPGGGDFKRSVCVEEFTYGADGSIPKVDMTTTGPTAVATLDPFQQVEAETIAFSSGLKTEVCTDSGGGMNVTSISNGDYIKVKEVEFLDGASSFDARVSSAGSDAKIELYLDSETGTLLGMCDVSGASSWTTKTCSVSGGSGKHDLFLKFTGSGGDLFKFNWWKFTGPTLPNGGGDAAVGGGDLGTGGSTAPESGGAGSGPLPGTDGGVGGAGGTLSGSGGSADSAGDTRSANGGTADPAGGTRWVAGATADPTGGTLWTSSGAVTGSGGATTAHAGGSNSGGQITASGGRGTSGGVGAPGAGGTVATQGSGGVPGSEAAGVTARPASGSCSCRVDTSRGKNGVSVALWLIASALVLRRRASARERRPPDMRRGTKK